jgi:LytS/YehU family sensor histidine kinase
LAQSDKQTSDLTSAWVLGAVVASVLGALRGAEQVVIDHAYAYPWRVVWAMSLASVVWLPVPVVVRRVLRSGMRARATWLSLGALALASAIVEPIWFFAVLWRVARWRPPGAYWISAALRLDTNLLIFAAIAGWLWLRVIGERREAAAERAASLRSRASAAELDVLTMQLQPHFLFNTLNLVSQLAFESTTRARRAMSNLRRLLEESVAPNRPATITLGEELRFLDAYLDLQRDRFADRLDARVVADVDLLATRVPRMLLQPIVENAIRHGLAPRKSGGAVVVRVRRAPGERVSIDVADDGVGLPDGQLHDGMGLANVRHRLEQLFPSATMIDVAARTGGGTTTRLEFPLDTQRATEMTPASVEEEVMDDLPPEPTPAVGVRAMVMVVGWALVAAMWTELEAIVPMAMGRAVPWARLLSENALNAGVWIALTPLTLRLADRLATRSRGGRIAAHAAGALVFATAHIVATSVLLRTVLHAGDVRVRSFQTSWAIWDLVAYAMLIAIGESIAVRARLREQRVESTRAVGRLAAARVALLRLHLQPSLLLSAIDAVDAAIDDPVRCESTITRLGDVLRILLATSDDEQTPLRVELALLEAYAAVVGQRATVALHDGVDQNATVPSGVLVALVSSTKTAATRVDVTRRGPRLALQASIETDAVFDPDVLARTERRLAAIYGREQAMRLTNSDARASLLIELPYRVGRSMAAESEQRAIA